ncbi:MAG TPA: ribosome maturation factor [Sulfurimonas sp.]|nr:MAG: Ribosome maturation factor RimP [uncultured Sulfurimonas sp.]CAI6152119.1 MAG: Ribosome maturation factor RimP [uncultured Sulfurimonas sp.]HIC13318.1 ribosome maturation factor [Sulfurimonas sp.]HIM74739.1 ribosome maturation factor [Campylobacterales bacterium]
MSLQSDIESIVKSVDLELYDAVIVSENDETIYRISIMSKEVEDGKRKGISLDTCVELTHMISPLLDVTPPVSGDYRLEVGTAGIERKLMNIGHFKKSVGEKVSILHSGKEKTRGVLLKVEGSKVFVESAEETVEVEFNDIIKAKTYFEW